VICEERYHTNNSFVQWRYNQEIKWFTSRGGGGSLVKLNDLDYLVAMLLYKLIVFEALHICKLVVHLFFLIHSGFSLL